MAEISHPVINLRVENEAGKNIFLLKDKLYIGTFPEDTYHSLSESVKLFFPKLKIECLKFKGKVLSQDYCPQDVFERSDASFCGVYPIEICIKN